MDVPSSRKGRRTERGGSESIPQPTAGTPAGIDRTHHYPDIAPERGLFFLSSDLESTRGDRAGEPHAALRASDDAGWANEFPHARAASCLPAGGMKGARGPSPSLSFPAGSDSLVRIPRSGAQAIHSQGP